MTSILVETGGPADDHISEEEAQLLGQIVSLVEKDIYSSMDTSHDLDEAALEAAVGAAGACNADIASRQTPGGDLGVLHQRAQDKQMELDR